MGELPRLARLPHGFSVCLNPVSFNVVAIILGLLPASGNIKFFHRNFDIIRL